MAITDKAEQLAYAKEGRAWVREELKMSAMRGATLADEFAKLEVQIAVLLFGLVIAFINLFNGLTLWMKIGVAFSMFSLLISLILGLVHIKRKEQFWNKIFEQRLGYADIWESAVTKESETSFDETVAFFKNNKKVMPKVISTPKWSWMMQSVFLGIAVVPLLIIALLYLFH